ncbi:glycosyltransferase [Mucilaginibacter sp.]
MKIAIVQDELVRKGGAEQVVLSFHAAFPEAPIYTLSYNAESTYPEFKECVIKTSWFGKIIKSDINLKRFFFPFGIIAMRQLKITDYDVVLQSTTHCAKYTKIDDNALVLTYCHTPFRLAWNADSYDSVLKASGIKKTILNSVIKYLRFIDKKGAERTNWFITNATEVVQRIKDVYHPSNAIKVINPPVKCSNFYISDVNKEYYLVVSRFEPYKLVDLVVKTFNNMPNKKLLIVGKGSMENELKALAGNNIEFKSNLDSAELSKIYSECRALIFPQLEDYGITPLEANASGRPVIAYGIGGINDTMIPFKDSGEKSTALFFNEQTLNCLTEAINKFENISFDPVFVRQHAEKFDESVFVEKIKKFVCDKYENRIINRPSGHGRFGHFS